jgi:uncharacterized protein YjbI with pentapeptide repeats
MLSQPASGSASHDGPVAARFGPHRFYAGEGGGSEQLRGARLEAADLRGARFTDCDLTGATIRDGWLVNVSISGYPSNVTVNGVEVTDFVNAELDRRHPELEPGQVEHKYYLPGIGNVRAVQVKGKPNEYLNLTGITFHAP